MKNIIYTITDESPYLATHSLLPIIKRFCASSGINFETKDISLAGRILASFPDFLTEEQRVPDALSELGALATRPEANIIKLPNISASVPQLKAAIAELQSQGYALPDYPENPADEAETAIKQRYDKVKGSAVNPVLREGNSDRRAPKSVKQYAQTHPHSMGAWSAESLTEVATMQAGDFYHNEQSVTLKKADVVRIELVSPKHEVQLLKAELPLQAGEVIDATFMSKEALCKFYKKAFAEAKDKGVLLSLHLKATMMKVSDPILFGYAVETYFANLFQKHPRELKVLGVNARNGLSDILAKIEQLPAEEQEPLKHDIEGALTRAAALAMVNSDRGITNLHFPNDVIVDASMPAMIRNGGKMSNAKGEAQDTLAVLPDSTYARIYQVVIDFCKKHGAFNPATMGSVANVGLMAQKAEEYGSHDKTFEIPHSGRVQVVGADGKVYLSHKVEKRRYLAYVYCERCCNTRLGEISGNTRTPQQNTSGLLVGRAPRSRCATHQKSKTLFGNTRYRGGRYPHYVARNGDALHLRAYSQGQRHHFGNGQCVARLPHRLVSYLGVGYQCQSALYRPFDERWRTL